MAVATPKYEPATVKGVTFELNRNEATHVLAAIEYYERKNYINGYLGIANTLRTALNKKIDINTVRVGAGGVGSANSVSVASF